MLKGSSLFKGVVLALMLLAGLLPSVWAAQVSGLYNAELLVAEQSVRVAPELVTRALEQVLVKVSGRRDLLELPALRAQMEDPARLIKQFSYQSTNQPKVAADGREVLAHRLRIEFAPPLVDDLLAAAGIRPLGATRPGVLVWVAEERRGLREYLGASEDPALRAMRERARERGLPIFQPLLDLQDESALPVSEAWGFFADSVLKASARYQADSVLVGRVYPLGDGWRSQWQLLWQGQVQPFDGQGETLEEHLASAVDQAADRLFAAFVTLGDGAYSEEGVVIRIDSVGNLDDYFAVTDYLGQQAGVERVLIDSVAGELLTLRVVMKGTLRQLQGVIELNNGFKALPGYDGQTALYYRWEG